MKKYFILYKAFSNLKLGEYDDALNLLKDYLEINPNEEFIRELKADVFFL